MEKHDDAPKDVKRATPVEREIKRGQKDDTFEGYPRLVEKKKRWEHCDKPPSKRFKPAAKSNGECCDQQRGKKKKTAKFAMVSVFEKPCTFPKLDIVPRHCLTKQKYIDMLAKPSRKCPPDCLKKAVLRKLKPVSARIKELAQPTRQRMLMTLQEGAATLPPAFLDNLVRTLEHETCLTPEQAAAISRKKKFRKKDKGRKAKWQFKDTSKSRKSRKSSIGITSAGLTFDKDSVTCQYLIAERFVRSILKWKCPVPNAELNDISEVIIRRLVDTLEYERPEKEDRKSQQVNFLAEAIACWVTGVLSEVAHNQEKKLIELCQRKEEEIKADEETDEETEEEEEEKIEVEDEEDEDEDEDEEDEGEGEGEEMERESSDSKMDEMEETEEERDEGEEMRDKATEDAEVLEADVVEETEVMPTDETEPSVEPVTETVTETEPEAEPEAEPETEPETTLDTAAIPETEDGMEEKVEAADAEEVAVEGEEAKIDSDVTEGTDPGEPQMAEVTDTETEIEPTEETKETEEKVGAEVETIAEEALPMESDIVEEQPEEPVVEVKEVEEEEEKEEKEEITDESKLAAEQLEEKVEEKVEEQVESFETEEKKKSEDLSAALEVKDTAEAEIPKDIIKDLNELFKTDIPFLTFGKIIDTVYKMIEDTPENTGKDPITNGIHRAIYGKLKDIAMLENPELLTEELKSVMYTVCGKIANWLRSILSKSQLDFMQQFVPEVESKEIRDWTKWLSYISDVAKDWNSWLRDVIEKMFEMESAPITRGEWRDWTKSVDAKALLWRRFHLQIRHRAHRNATTMSGRRVVKTSGNKPISADPSEQLLRAIDADSLA